jgi:hypothetical protein
LPGARWPGTLARRTLRPAANDHCRRLTHRARPTLGGRRLRRRRVSEPTRRSSPTSTFMTQPLLWSGSRIAARR